VHTLKRFHAACVGLAPTCLNIKEIPMKRTVAFVSLAAALAVAALAQNSSVVKDDCNDCPIHNCPLCPHSK
jgi:hypothetical protein